MKKRTKEAWISHTENRVDPDTFIVLTVKQGLRLDSGGVIPPSPEVYDRVAAGVLDALSAHFYKGKRYRKRNRFRNLSTIEGGGNGNWHINICLRRPDGVSIEEFKTAVQAAWMKSMWYMPVFYVEEITGNAVSYIMKEGPDCVLLKSTKM